jgi:hypothetical protein
MPLSSRTDTSSAGGGEASGRVGGAGSSWGISLGGSFGARCAPVGPRLRGPDRGARWRTRGFFAGHLGQRLSHCLGRRHAQALRLGDVRQAVFLHIPDIVALGLGLGRHELVAGAHNTTVVALRFRVGLHGQRGHALARRLGDEGRLLGCLRRRLRLLQVARRRWPDAAPGCPSPLDVEAATLVEGVQSPYFVLVKAANVLVLLVVVGVVALVEELHTRKQRRRHISRELGGDVALEMGGGVFEGPWRQLQRWRRRCCCGRAVWGLLCWQ